VGPALSAARRFFTERGMEVARAAGDKGIAEGRRSEGGRRRERGMAEAEPRRLARPNVVLASCGVRYPVSSEDETQVSCPRACPCYFGQNLSMLFWACDGRLQMGCYGGLSKAVFLILPFFCA
jgi:hypothetical protein